MEIIKELEKKFRGVYTGTVGYVSNNKNMDFNILIRTLVKNENTLTIRTGAGIVFDSQANKELKETEHKAKAVLSVF